jgi:hypothetical protein
MGAVGQANGEGIAASWSALFVLEAKALIDPRLLVEIEATAIISA